MNAHTVAFHRRAILARTSLIDLRNALITARRINDRAMLDTLKTEIARRLGA